MILREDLQILIFILMASTITDGPPPDIVKKNAIATCNEKNVSIHQKSDGDWGCNCPPGFYKEGDSRFGQPETTICSECPFDENDSNNQYYMDVENNDTECSKSPNKSYCSSFMNTHYVVGSTTESSRCECNEGFYTNSIPTDYGCNKHSPCTHGFQPVVRGNATMDTKCEKCPPGTFSNVSSASAPCVKFKTCLDFEVLKFEGNSTNDVACLNKSIIPQTTSYTTTPVPTPAPVDQGSWGSIGGAIAAVTILIIIIIIIVIRCRKRKGGKTKNVRNGDAESPLMDEPQDESNMRNGNAETERSRPASSHEAEQKDEQNVRNENEELEEASPANPPADELQDESSMNNKDTETEESSPESPLVVKLEDEPKSNGDTEDDSQDKSPVGNGVPKEEPEQLFENAPLEDNMQKRPKPPSQVNVEPRKQREKTYVEGKNYPLPPEENEQKSPEDSSLPNDRGDYNTTTFSQTAVHTPNMATAEPRRPKSLQINGESRKEEEACVEGEDHPSVPKENKQKSLEDSSLPINGGDRITTTFSQTAVPTPNMAIVEPQVDDVLQNLYNDRPAAIRNVSYDFFLTCYTNSEIGKPMIDCLEKESDKIVRPFIRSLLKEKGRVEEIHTDDKDKGIREVKYQWIAEVKKEQGRDLTPKFLFKARTEYQSIKDAFRKEFYKQLEQSYNNARR